MKKILISTCIAIALVSCKEPDTQHEQIISDTDLEQIQPQQHAPLIPKTYLCDFPYGKNIDEINVVTIGECEYLVANAQNNSDITMTHKGDCKFCMQRQEELIRRILLEKIH